MRLACIQQKAKAVWDYESVREDIVLQLREAGAKKADLAILPECAYPAYFLGADKKSLEQALLKTYQILSDVQGICKEFLMHVVIGIVIPRDGKLYNAALMFDDNGELIGSVNKSNLWSFDSRWFTKGDEWSTVNTKFGKIGMMICADGRIPEIARILKLQGAKLIVDPVNLVASASYVKDLTNPQCTYMLPVRAMENRVFLATANKCGVEANVCVYSGRSMVIDPNGEIIAECPPDKPMVLCCDIDLDQELLLTDIRNPAQYHILAEPTAALPIYQNIQKALTPSENELMVSVVQYRAANANSYVKRAKDYIKRCELLDAKLIFLPRLPIEIDALEIVQELLGSLGEDSVAAISTGVPNHGEGILIARNKILGQWHQGTAPVTIDTHIGAVSMLFDREPYIPELPRAAMLSGTEILLWSDVEKRPMNINVEKTRATENKMFVMRTSCCEQDVSNVVGPNGSIITTVFYDADQAASGLLFRYEGLSKTVIPGTHIVNDRLPECYKELIV